MGYGNVNDLALHEIAAGMCRESELAPFLVGPGGKRSLPPPNPGPRLRDGGSASAAAAPASRSREGFIHDATKPTGGMNDAEVTVFR